MTVEPRDIFGFVLALLVVGNVALAWIIYELRHKIRASVSELLPTVNRLSSFVAKHRAEIDKLSAKLAEVEAQSPLELGVKVVELSEAVERLRKTHQKFAGRISQELGTVQEDPNVASRDELRRAHAKDIMPAGLRK